MRTSFTLVLTAAALGCGIVTASAAGPDVNQLAPNSAARAGLVPDQKPGNGLAAIKAHPGSALKGDTMSGLSAAQPASAEALARPEDGHWRNGLASLSASLEAVMPNNAASRDALMAPAGMATSGKGLAALKGAPQQPNAFSAQMSTAAPAGAAELQRPEGTQWSSGLNSIRVRR